MAQTLVCKKVFRKPYALFQQPVSVSSCKLGNLILETSDAKLETLNATLFLRSLAYLRPGQVTYRALRGAQYRCYRAVPQLTARWLALDRAPQASPHAVETIRKLFESSFPHLNRPLKEDDKRIADLLSGRFTYLNQTLELKKVDWNARYISHLWNYQLHYFGFSVWCVRDFLERGDEHAMRRCQELIEDWIETARIGHSDGWDAYPISLRVVNWIYAYALVAGRYDDPRFLELWRASIYRQLDFLSRHVEYHLLANHLIKNAKALVIGGSFFAGDPRGAKWLAQGKKLLWRELEEQVLEDGGHYERSPMYHTITLADFLECFALLEAFRSDGERRKQASAEAPSHSAFIEVIRQKLCAMTRFLAAMTGPDGSLALFNDSANTEEAEPLPIISAAECILGDNLRSYPLRFPETGYYLWNSRDGADRIIADAGPPSVSYNPGHAHCDLLSYELWIRGKPFVVDSGVHGYAGDRFREYSRSTRAHNTVSINGHEQSEVWGSFRMARRAEVLEADAYGGEKTWNFRGVYRPYYDAACTHERQIQRQADGEWVFTDIVRAAALGDVSSFVHLHPGVQARKAPGECFVIECRCGSNRMVIEPFGVDSVDIVEGAELPIQGWYFPDFGIAKPSPTIVLKSRLRSAESFGYRIKVVGSGQ